MFDNKTCVLLIIIQTSMAAGKLEIVLFILILLLSIYNCEYIKCVPQETDTDTPLPLRKNITHFHTRYETLIPDFNSTSYKEEYYDYDLNKVAIKHLYQGLEYKTIADFNTEEIFVINIKDRTCSVFNFNSTSFLDLYEFTDESNHLSGEKLFHMTTEKLEHYYGKTLVRNFNVDHYDFCSIKYREGQEIQNLRMSVYAIDNENGEWTFQSKESSFPIKIDVNGFVTNPSTGQPIQVRLEENFFYWSTKPFTNLEIFQIPRGIICPYRKTQRPFPELPEQFSLSVEMVIKSKKIRTNTKIWYDSPNTYRINYYDIENQNDRLITEIYDFYSGIVYKYYPYSLDTSCVVQSTQTQQDKLKTGRSISNIHQAFVAFKRKFLSDRSPENHKFTYVGQRYENFIKCDIWSTKRKDWPGPNSGVTTSWEWAFAVNETIGSHPQCNIIPTDAPYPVKLSINVLSFNSTTPAGVFLPGEEIHFNFYDISLFPLDSSAFDVSPCYSNKKKLRIEFAIKGKVSNAEFVDAVDLLEREIYQALVKMLNIHPLRIVNFRVFQEDQFKIKFTLLDKPPVLDSVAENSEASLNSVFSFLCKEIFAGNINFRVSLDSDGIDQITINADPWSLVVNEIEGRPDCNSAPKFKDPMPKVTFYNSAQLTGLGIGMTVLGIILGSIGLHTHLTKKMKKMEPLVENRMDVPSMSMEPDVGEEVGDESSA